MKFTGRLKEPIIDYLTGRLTILFEPCEDFRQTLRNCGIDWREAGEQQEQRSEGRA